MAIAQRPPGALDIHLRGHADVTFDTAELNRAEAALNANAAGGTLWLEGHFKTNDYYSFTKQVDVRRVGSQALIEVTDPSAVAVLGWNRSAQWDDGISYAFSMYNAFTSRFSPVGFSPSAGDWVYLEADNVLSGVVVHNDGGEQRPMELHQIVHWDSTGGYAYTRQPIVDLMTTTPTCNTVDMKQGPVVEGIEFMLTDTVTPADYTHFLSMSHCVDARVIGCVLHRTGTGGIKLYGCANFLMQGGSLGGMNKEDGIYAATISLCNGTVFDNVVITGYRHGPTTASGRSSGLTRWGTPLGLVVKNCELFEHCKLDVYSGDVSNTTGILDTHAEGFGTVYEGNRIWVQGNTGNTVVNIRNRSAIVRGNTIIGGHNDSAYSSATGVLITGPDCKVHGNHFERLFYGVRTALGGGDYYTWCNRAEIYENTFKDIQGNAVRATVGDAIKVKDNRFLDVGRQSVNLPQATKACIQFGDLRQHTATFTAASQNVTSATNNLYTYADSSSGAGLQVYFTTTGTLPAELSAGKSNKYWIVSSSSQTVFQISATRDGTPITFTGAGTGVHTMHGPGHPGTDHEISGNDSDITFQGTNDNFLETGDLDTTDLSVAGNTVIGYSGAAFSDRYSKRSAMQTAFDSLNWGM